MLAEADFHIQSKIQNLHKESATYVAHMNYNEIYSSFPYLFCLLPPRSA